MGPSDEGLPYSKAVRAGDMVFISGMVAFDDNGEIAKGGIEAETTKVLEDLQQLMMQIGGTLDDIVKVHICLPNKEDFEQFNQVYRRYFSANQPARDTVCADLTIDASVEIVATAYMPQV